MKGILALVFSSTVLFAQPVSYGLKAGVPMTDLVSAASGSQAAISASSDRYIVGPEVELHLPFGLGVEFDVLYRRFSYAAVSSLPGLLSSLSGTGSSWEFPLLVKKHFLPGPVHPFVDAGVNFNKLTGLTQTVQAVAGASSAPSNDFTKGFTMGAGVDVHVLLLHITPELRYTRWGSQSLNSILPGGTVSSNQNQAEFLVGFTF
jgi:opacity protein-like surface antigen